ncbi:hypothetical protein Avbf_05980 [Armadillidium vulgare]|nr:hypothetical protein Avbf_05980 [Armadillidium vulgare]
MAKPTFPVVKYVLLLNKFLKKYILDIKPSYLIRLDNSIFIRIILVLIIYHISKMGKTSSDFILGTIFHILPFKKVKMLICLSEKEKLFWVKDFACPKLLHRTRVVSLVILHFLYF